MLARLYAEHQEKQKVLKLQNDGRRREVLHAVPRVTDALVTSVNQNVSEIFGNQVSGHFARLLPLFSFAFPLLLLQLSLHVAAALLLTVACTCAQRFIEREVRGLQEQSARFTKQTQMWLQSIDTFNGNMKELGDFETYAANIEGDMRTIATAIQMITQRSRQPPPKPPGAGSPGGVGSPGGGSPRLIV